MGVRLVVVDVGRTEEPLQHGAFRTGVFDGLTPERQEDAAEPLRGERIGVPGITNGGTTINGVSAPISDYVMPAGHQPLN
jgi:hypothetical protein